MRSRGFRYVGLYCRSVSGAFILALNVLKLARLITFRVEFFPRFAPHAL